MKTKPTEPSNTWTPICEWCGTKLIAVEASGETEPGVIKAVGWCTKCNARLWSKPKPSLGEFFTLPLELPTGTVPARPITAASSLAAATLGQFVPLSMAEYHIPENQGSFVMPSGARFGRYRVEFRTQKNGVTVSQPVDGWLRS